MAAVHSAHGMDDVANNSGQQQQTAMYRAVIDRGASAMDRSWHLIIVIIIRKGEEHDPIKNSAIKIIIACNW